MNSVLEYLLSILEGSTMPLRFSSVSGSSMRASKRSWSLDLTRSQLPKVRPLRMTRAISLSDTPIWRRALAPAVMDSDMALRFGSCDDEGASIARIS